MSYRVHHVTAGQTLAGIANTYYNDPHFCCVILNEYGTAIANPNMIYPGQLLSVPMLDDLQNVTVHSGDTLSNIALVWLENANLYPVILDESNQPFDNPSVIKVGQTVHVPMGAHMPANLNPFALGHMEYHRLEPVGRTITLVDGTHSAQDAVLDGRITTTRLTRCVFGDVTDDGVSDAIAILSTHTAGTTGHFINLAVVRNEVATRRHIATEMLGDRVQIESLRIREQEITAVIADPRAVTVDHPQGTLTTRTWNLDGERLVEVERDMIAFTL